MATQLKPGANGKARALTALRRDFPSLRRGITYLDTASTAQKPRAVIEAVRGFYAGDCAKEDATHRWGERATDAYEEVRATAAAWINAGSPREVVFVRHTTEAINVVANGFGEDVLKPGDEVLVTQMEHHSNLIPWQTACARSGARLRVAPVTRGGLLDLDALERLLTDRTKILAVVHLSNVLGHVNPVREIVRLARRRGVPVLLDGAQAAAHLPVDVSALGCDFYVFSAHKMCGPTGVGVLWGKPHWLRTLPPLLTGEPMAKEVYEDSATLKQPPRKFESGVASIAEAVGFGAALDYLGGVGMDRVEAHVRSLTEYAAERLAAIDRVRLVGEDPARVSVVSFVVEGVEAEKVAEYLDREADIAVHSGRLSAHPLMEALRLTGAVRASFALYNTRREADALAAAVAACVKELG